MLNLFKCLFMNNIYQLLRKNETGILIMPMALEGL